MANPIVDLALECVRTRKYIYITLPHSHGRISRKAAINAILDTTRCKDCIGGFTRCAECDQVESKIRIDGSNIYLEGFHVPVIIHV